MKNCDACFVVNTHDYEQIKSNFIYFASEIYSDLSVGLLIKFVKPRVAGVRRCGLFRRIKGVQLPLLDGDKTIKIHLER